MNDRATYTLTDDEVRTSVMWRNGSPSGWDAEAFDRWLSGVRADALRQAADAFRDDSRWGDNIYPGDLDLMAEQITA